MHHMLHRIAVAALLIPAALPAVAWAPETRIRMVDEAVRFMPDALRLALEHHRPALLRGALEPMAGEDGPDHLPAWAGGRLAATVGDEAGALLEALGEPTGFDELARRFGRLAHYVADAAFPPGASRGDGARRYRHFAAFCESRRERFPLVFHERSDAALRDGDFAGYARRLLEQAAVDDVELGQAYAAAGEPPAPAAFDDRSVPFAVGSLAYSRTINDIARAWLTAWHRADGDMGRRVTAARTAGGAADGRGER